MPPLPTEVLGHLPDALRGELLREFDSVIRNFREGKWEPSELNVGKLCEVVYTILRGHVDGTFAKRASKPKNMYDACKAFEKFGKTHPRTVAITMPRLLVALYEFRNNRGVGHVGGDVDANHMDAVFLVQGAKWLLGELVRIFHDVDIDTATQVVDALADRTIPIIWEVGGMKRVLDPSMSMRDRTLALLYSEPGPIAEDDLVAWTEHSNASVYRRDILRRLHRSKHIEYDEQARTAQLSPLGSQYVEENLVLNIA